MRAKLIYSKKVLKIDAFSKFFEKECKTLKMDWSIKPADYQPNTAIFVSKYGHCLQDLMYRVDSGILPMNVSCIISNHMDHKKIADWHEIPFFYVPVTKENKPDLTFLEGACNTVGKIMKKNSIPQLVELSQNGDTNAFELLFSSFKTIKLIAANFSFKKRYSIAISFKF